MPPIAYTARVWQQIASLAYLTNGSDQFGVTAHGRTCHSREPIQMAEMSHDAAFRFRPHATRLRLSVTAMWTADFSKTCRILHEIGMAATRLTFSALAHRCVPQTGF